MLRFGMEMPLALMSLYGTLLLLAVLAVRALVREILPKRLLVLLWCLVLCRFLIPFSLSAPFSAPAIQWQGAPAAAEQEAFVQDTVESGLPQAAAAVLAPESWLPDRRQLLALAFAVGAAVTAGILLRQRRRYAARLKDALLVEHNETINAVLRSQGMGRVLVFTCDELASPLVSGLWQPRIYLPSGMDFSNRTLLRHVLAHEAMHIRRRDNWVKAAMVVALCLNWYNPLVWLMANCLCADLEAACDEAVLRQLGAGQRQSYAESLLLMAVSAGRESLLYSAFSKTAVERRIRSVLGYHRATALAVCLSLAVLLGGTAVLAAGSQAPFEEELSSFCLSANNQWGAKASLARGLALPDDAEQQANRIIQDTLYADETGDPEILQAQIAQALADAFGVEPGAFRVKMQLCLSEEERRAEYAAFGITDGADGWPVYRGEPVRVMKDETLGFYTIRGEGETDLEILRDRLGKLTEVRALHEGDPEFDRRTRERAMDGPAAAMSPYSIGNGGATAENTQVDVQAQPGMGW